MVDLKGFRRCNKLRQQELADFLNVTRGYISLVETGASKLSEDKLAMLLANQLGWDTSALLNGPSQASITANATGNSSAQVRIGGNDNNTTEIALLKAEVESLKAQLAEEKQRSAQYWEMIQKLMK